MQSVDLKSITPQIFNVLDTPPPAVPPKVTARQDADDWSPRLNPTQREAYECTADFILQYGGKASGKSEGGIHAMIRHCYEERDALAILIAPQIRSGKEGSFARLERLLDVWQNGNWTDRHMRTRADAGIGLQYTKSVMDPNTKDRCLFISNRHGGWSKVILMSLPYASVVEKRMKNIEPSFVYVEEITELEAGTGYTGEEFFTFVALQLNRRPFISGPQQYYASCNPEGPSHWVYKKWFIDCVDSATGE